MLKFSGVRVPGAVGTILVLYLLRGDSCSSYNDSGLYRLSLAMPELFSPGRGTINTELSIVEMPVIAERRERYQNSSTQQEINCVIVSLENVNEQDIKNGSTGLVRKSNGICKSSGICTGMRGWSTIYSVLTAALLSLIGGFTMGFSSPTLIELAKLEDPELRFGNTLSDVFGVSFFFEIWGQIGVYT